MIVCPIHNFPAERGCWRCKQKLDECEYCGKRVYATELRLTKDGEKRCEECMEDNL